MRPFKELYFQFLFYETVGVVVLTRCDSYAAAHFVGCGYALFPEVVVDWVAFIIVYELQKRYFGLFLHMNSNSRINDISLRDMIYGVAV